MLSPFRSLRNYLMTAGLAGLTGLGFGCVITTGGGGNCDECGGVLCHSDFNSAGECVCDPGYEWEDPNDDDNYECDPIPPKPASADACDGSDNNVLMGDECFCLDGFNWCSSDPNDFTCCEDDQQGQTGGTQGMGDDDDDDDDDDDSEGGSETAVADEGSGSDGGLMCEEVSATPSDNVPNDEDCTAELMGAEFCSNGAADGPAGSRYFVCNGDVWEEMPGVPDEICMFDGFDFAYGCVLDGDELLFDCGVGSGADCSGAECNGCVDSDIFQECSANKLSEDSCARICQEEGDADGITYDSGTCEESDEGPVCACCDEGDEGCPV